MNPKESMNVFLRALVLLLFISWVFFLVKPFLLIILWAIILAVALFPSYKKLIKNSFGKRKKLITLGYTLAIAAIFIVPAFFMTQSMVISTIQISDQINEESLDVFLPHEEIKTIPLFGEQLYEKWEWLATNITQVIVDNRETIIEYGKSVLSGFTGFLITLFAFIFSFLIAIVFMYKADTGYDTAQKLMRKLAGESGEDLVHISRDTIRSVVKGILLVAIIQATLSFIAYAIMGIPAAGFFAFLVMVAAIVQLPAILAMIPPIIIAFTQYESTSAILFTIFMVLVTLSDNFLKPILLGKGLQTPMIVILIGTIGGLLLHGIIGLFIGAVVLSIAHRIYIFWVNQENA